MGPGVLCPRADTEVVAETAARDAGGRGSAPGAGPLRRYRLSGPWRQAALPAAQIVCVEKSQEAYVYLEKNTRLALERPGGSTENVLDARLLKSRPSTGA